jgi:hypothetical protein
MLSSNNSYHNHHHHHHHHHNNDEEDRNEGFHSLSSTSPWNSFGNTLVDFLTRRRGFSGFSVLGSNWSRGTSHGQNRNSASDVGFRLSMMNREFTDQDYELLLQLDETIQSKRGATKEEIASLTVRKVEEGEELDRCCICLGEMEEDMSIKKLPCNHYFHVECIDQWLHGMCWFYEIFADGDDDNTKVKNTYTFFCL